MGAESRAAGCYSGGRLAVRRRGGHLGQGHLLPQVVVSLLQPGELFEQILVALPLVVQLGLQGRLPLRRTAAVL